MKKIYKVFSFVVGIVLLALIASCGNSDMSIRQRDASYSNQINDKEKITPEDVEEQKKKNISIISENKVEIDKLWEFTMDGQIRGLVTEDDILYILSKKGRIYIVNNSDLKILKSFKLPFEYNGDFMELKVDNGILAMGYKNRVIVVDTKSEKMLFDHKVSGRYLFGDLGRGVLISGDLVIFSHDLGGITYGMKYNTEEVVWKHDRGYKGGSVDLFQFKNRYLYEEDFRYYEFDVFVN